MGQSVKDESLAYSNELSESLTHMIKEIYACLNSLQLSTLHKKLKQLILSLGFRGILTCLGLRKTVGSQDIAWPSAAILLTNFNKPN
jgi:hypothetical protein